MKFALPLDKDGLFYRFNPCGADTFSIYTVHKEKEMLTYALLNSVANPWHNIEGATCSHLAENGGCDAELKNNIEHILDHYAMLEVLSRCDYLLGDNFCDNTRKALRNAGIKAYNVPPFLTEIKKIITHFLIGVNVADSSGNIHYAS